MLHEKLPKPVKPLCISLLGSGIDEQKSLEESVSSILGKQDRWNPSGADESIESLKASLHTLKTEKAEIEYRIRSTREEETFQHSIIDGRYSGTAAKIALKLQKESAEYGWFKDRISHDSIMPFSTGDLINLRNEIGNLTPEIEAEYRLILPSLDEDLPSREMFEDHVKRYSDAESRFSACEDLLTTPTGRILERADVNDLNRMIEAVSKLIAAAESIRKRPMSWIGEAVHDILTDNDTPWKELLKTFSANITGLKERARKVQNATLTTPDGVNRKKLLYDAKSLRSHLSAGGKIGWGPFRPKVVRDCNYLLKNVQIDGRPCNALDSLDEIIELLSVKQAIDNAWRLWEGRTNRKTGPLSLQVAELEELQEALTSVVGLYDHLNCAKESANSVTGFGEPAWHEPAAISNLLDLCRAVILKNELENIKEKFNQLTEKIAFFAKHPDTHPVANKTLLVINSRNTDAYPDLLTEIRYLSRKKEIITVAQNTRDKLLETAPLFAQELFSNPAYGIWEKRLTNMDGAWTWVRANSWLNDFLKKEDLISLERRLKQVDYDINNRLAELSSILAWRFCFSRMNEFHRKHLVEWHREFKAIKGGTGRHAPRHRLNAQQHLNECRAAVPSWVMPLHRVYETVKPAPGIFDVIIVDEASQCGLEALPLAYLAKQLLVVGDDQQISPEAVGVDRDQVVHLMTEHLKNFAHADSFDVENSLFGHGKRLFRNRIVLREHFRCMPEIIRFSNDLCYHATPLIPLRQYPPQRLDPLKLVHVIDGYREGKNSRAINRREAEKLVESVVQCCNDDRYNGKTMGVIILQGDSQAALIESILLKELGAEEIEQRRLVCGNPYSFQGDERDIIFLSMVAAPNERIGAFVQPADQRRFNVAASRAKDQMWLFHTATRNDLSASCLRRRLLEYFENPKSQLIKALGEEAETLTQLAYSANRRIERPPQPFDSWFEVDIALHIASRGYRVVPQYPVLENKRIDLVVEGAKSRLAVECDGDHWHGAEQYDKDMERQRMLERCGWIFFRIRECAYYANPTETLETLWQVLGRQGIKPITAETVTDEIYAEDNCDNTLNSKGQDHASSVNSENVIAKQQGNDSAKLPLLYRQPINIQEVLSMKQAHLRDVIIETLKTRPNCSCVKDALPGFVLKQLQVISRGKPREEFCRKVEQSLKHLERESIIKIYKATNLRVKLINPPLDLFT